MSEKSNDLMLSSQIAFEAIKQLNEIDQKYSEQRKEFVAEHGAMVPRWPGHVMIASTILACGSVFSVLGIAFFTDSMSMQQKLHYLNIACDAGFVGIGGAISSALYNRFSKKAREYQQKDLEFCREFAGQYWNQTQNAYLRIEHMADIGQISVTRKAAFMKGPSNSDYIITDGPLYRLEKSEKAKYIVPWNDYMRVGPWDRDHRRSAAFDKAVEATKRCAAEPRFQS